MLTFPLVSAVAVPIRVGVLAYAIRLTVSRGAKPPAEATKDRPGNATPGFTSSVLTVPIVNPETKAVWSPLAVPAIVSKWDPPVATVKATASGINGEKLTSFQIPTT
jgi:hypothetical protein